MPPTPCHLCKTQRALILRPKNHQKLCKTCFIDAFERETHETIQEYALFTRGERVAIGASGGKDSTVLASVLKTLNERYDYGLDLVLLSIDEGITGYRDDSLETVKRNADQYGMPLKIVGYKELYGWTMDEVVGQVGKKGNCTYCGVFRRQALDRGAAMLGIKHVVTGHNADDVAETVLMNCGFTSELDCMTEVYADSCCVVLRGDLPRLSRATAIMTSSSSSPIKRSKPLKYAYEKEIVLYAHHKKLDYFSTECIYSPEAFRGSARQLIKNLERIRPSAILDVVKSGEDMAKCVPPELGGGGTSNIAKVGATVDDDAEEGEGGCGSANGRSSGGEMSAMERKLQEDEAAEAEGREVEVKACNIPHHGQRHDREGVVGEPSLQVPSNQKPGRRKGPARTEKKVNKQQMGQCERCGYLSSQAVCKACMLLEGLNKNRPKTDIQLGVDAEESSMTPMRQQMDRVALAGGPEG